MPNNVLSSSQSVHFLPYLQPKIAPSVLITVKELMNRKWQFYVVKQSRGRTYLNLRQITLPIWSFQQSPTSKPGFATWYTAHECAHALVVERYTDYLSIGHGPRFMECLQEICPKEFLHYETGYKPRNAMAAGISKHENGKGEIVKIGNKAYDIDMGDLL